MPSLPPKPLQLSARESHHSRQMAESFGSDPERCERTRPRYPEAMVERVVAAIPGPDVLDVGIGTGISARAFQAAGVHVLGVEVDPRMAEFARRTGLEVEVAKFEEWDPAGRGFDAVISGQTWHWIDPIAGARKVTRGRNLALPSVSAGPQLETSSCALARTASAARIARAGPSKLARNPSPIHFTTRPR